MLWLDRVFLFLRSATCFTGGVVTLSQRDGSMFSYKMAKHDGQYKA